MEQEPLHGRLVEEEALHDESGDVSHRRDQREHLSDHCHVKIMARKLPLRRSSSSSAPAVQQTG